jgi:glycosyltransferase involved in cell wall biosynthesis
VKVLAVAVVPAHVKASGAVNAALRLSAELKAYCDISFVQLADQDASYTSRDLPVRTIGCRLPLNAVLQKAPRKIKSVLYRSDVPALVAQGSYDLVHLHNPVPTLELQRIARACTAKGTPYVFSTHGIVEVTSGGAAYGVGRAQRLAWHLLVTRPLRWVIAHAKAILALSEADLPILKTFGYPENQIRIVPNGVDAPQTMPAPSETERVAKKYGIPTRSGAWVPRCLYLGVHAPNKGLHILLDALMQTDRSFDLIVGGGKSSHLDYDAYAGRLKSGQRIVFTGFVDQQDVSALYALADLFVFPSLADTFPLVVLEAMAHSVPVLSTRVGGIPNQVDEACGRLVAPGDAAALRRTLEEMTENRDVLRAMGERAREKVRAQFDWLRSAREAYAAIAACALRPRPRRRLSLA